MKRFENKDRNGPPSTRSGPRARAAQERKFGDARSRDSNRGDPYQRAERPPSRAGPARDAPYGERLRAPARAGIVLDPDVARVFRDSEAVNEALRLVIRLARLTGGSRPAFNRDRPFPGPRPGPSPDRYSRDDRPRERRGPPPRAPKFDDAE